MSFSFLKQIISKSLINNPLIGPVGKNIYLKTLNTFKDINDNDNDTIIYQVARFSLGSLEQQLVRASWKVGTRVLVRTYLNIVYERPEDGSSDQKSGRKDNSSTHSNFNSLMVVNSTDENNDQSSNDERAKAEEEILSGIRLMFRAWRLYCSMKKHNPQDDIEKSEGKVANELESLTEENVLQTDAWEQLSKEMAETLSQTPDAWDKLSSEAQKLELSFLEQSEDLSQSETVMYDEHMWGDIHIEDAKEIFGYDSSYIQDISSYDKSFIKEQKTYLTKPKTNNIKTIALKKGVESTTSMQGKSMLQTAAVVGVFSGVLFLALQNSRLEGGKKVAAVIQAPVIASLLSSRV